MIADRLGINVHLLNDLSGWAAAASLGVRFCRIDLNWDTAQPAIDRWDWQVIDLAVSGATSHGLSIYATLSHTPTWANASAGRGAPPTSIDYWTRFVREVGLRYGPQSSYGQIKVWGIWNEFQGSVSDYVNLLLRPARETLKAIHAENAVCGPEIATEGDWSAWLHTFLISGGELIDVLTIHAYDDTGVRVWEKLVKPRLWYEVWKKRSVKQVVEQAGYVKKPCWVTETGWQSSHVGDDGQAQRWDQLLARLQGSSWPSGLVAYQLVDEEPPDQPPVTYGVFRANGTRKPAADVLRRYAGGGTV